MLAKQTRGDITCHNICDPDVPPSSRPRPLLVFCIFCMFLVIYQTLTASSPFQLRPKHTDTAKKNFKKL